MKDSARNKGASPKRQCNDRRKTLHDRFIFFTVHYSHFESFDEVFTVFLFQCSIKTCIFKVSIHTVYIVLNTKGVLITGRLELLPNFIN